ncbi:kinase-like domain-containing protein, partial [Pisolithus orientalis]|uniref:kinase-like domain-containing protein n=1 Tax=Pisolithus orientalis TaxID=936130 RepID=UPI0022251D47
IWSQLQHENIIPLLGITTKFDRTVSMVTEWMERGNAHQYVQDIAVDPHPLLLDIACGMNYLHSHGIAHGDLKGENVLISGGGRALITDFGFSCLLNLPPILDVDPPRGGTLWWMAPEKLDTCAITQEADIWAFGMTTLELFSRRNPFHEVCTELRIACCISRGPPIRLSNESTCYRLCLEWWDMCLECWKQDLSACQTMNDIVAKV